MGILAWWRRRRERSLPKLEIAPPAPRRELIHWRPGAAGNPICGSAEWRLWTVEPEHATCPGCVSRRDGITLRRFVSVR